MKLNKAKLGHDKLQMQKRSNGSQIGVTVYQTDILEETVSATESEGDSRWTARAILKHLGG